MKELKVCRVCGTSLVKHETKKICSFCGAKYSIYDLNETFLVSPSKVNNPTNHIQEINNKSEMVLDGVIYDCSRYLQFDKMKYKSKEFILLFDDYIYKIKQHGCMEEYEDCLENIYTYFFDGIYAVDRKENGRIIEFYEAYKEFIEHGTAGKFQDCCIKFLQRTGCIRDTEKDIAGMQDVQIIVKYLKAKVAGYSILFENGKITNGKMENRTPLAENLFYREFLSVFSSILEENNIVKYGF